MADSIHHYGHMSDRDNLAGAFSDLSGPESVRSMPIGGDVKQVSTATVNAAADAIVASSSGAVVTVTALTAGEGFTLALGSSETRINAPTTTTANADAPDILPGCAVVREYGTSGNKAKCTRPNEDNATAKVMTATPANVTNSESYSITVIGDLDGDGVEESYVCPAYSSASATLAELLDHFKNWGEASFPADSIAATEDGSALTLTAEIAGLDFRVVANVGHDIDADGAPTGSIAIATSTANVAHEWAGVCLNDGTLTVGPNNDAAYRASRGNVPSIAHAPSKPIWVRLDDDVTSISLSDPVGFRVNADGADEVFGSWRNAKSGSDICILLKTQARWASEDIKTDLDGHQTGLIQILA